MIISTRRLLQLVLKMSLTQQSWSDELEKTLCNPSLGIKCIDVYQSGIVSEESDSEDEHDKESYPDCSSECLQLRFELSDMTQELCIYLHQFIYPDLSIHSANVTICPTDLHPQYGRSSITRNYNWFTTSSKASLKEMLGHVSALGNFSQGEVDEIKKHLWFLYEKRKSLGFSRYKESE